MSCLLQVCNVGRIVGGTAACAWSVTRALPGWKHTVVFFSKPCAETRAAFAGCEVIHVSRITRKIVRQVSPDFILLHNTHRDRGEDDLGRPTIQFLHSRIRPAAADVTIYCSRWLAERYGSDVKQVCYQGVPRAIRQDDFSVERALRESIVVGRICTPRAAKWPAWMPEFYAELATKFSNVAWDFVGCPPRMQGLLHSACRGRAKFYEPGWQQRTLMWQWDALLYHNPGVTESFGRTVAEAMRVGCIPVVDRQGGFVEQLNFENRLLCGDRSDFISALERLHDQRQRLEWSRRCRAEADERFSLGRFSESLAKWLERAERGRQVIAV